jgi:uncharacterized protein (TIRG00374 family)
MAPSRKYLTFFISALITLLALYYIYVNLEISALLFIFANANWVWLFFGFVVYIANYMVRAIRFNFLLPDNRIRFRKMLAITSIYGMYNYLLPIKSGELSFVAISASKLDVSVSQSTAVLVVTRLFDLVVMAIFIPFIMVVFWKYLSSTLIVIFMIYCFLAFVVLVYFIRWLKRFSLPDQNDKAVNDGKFIQILNRLRAGMYVVEQRKLYIPLFLSTILIWFLICLNFYSIVIALGNQINFIQAVVICVFMIPTTLLPVQGFANVGTHEIGWVAAFALFNYPESVAISIAIGSHGILLIFVLILGLTGFIMDALDQ